VIGLFKTCLILSVAFLLPSQQHSFGPEKSTSLHRGNVGSASLLFQSSQNYVAMGAAPELGLSTFTLETWFRMDGLGGSMGTGSHGIHTYPLIAKGNGNTDPADKTLDINYILGVQTPADGPLVLVADFECTDANPWRNGMNHTIYGVTPIEFGDWHHVAATYDGFEWRLYLDGTLEMRTVHRMIPQYDSQHHFGVGTSLDNEGLSHGHFNGAIDEVRIWDYARDENEIRTSLNEEIMKESGLIARWGFNEGEGSTAFDSAGSGIHGTINVASWSTGAPMDINLSPEYDDATICPTDDSSVTSVNLDLSFVVHDPESDEVMVTFYGRQKKVRVNPYTIAVIPDTQHYVRENWFPHHFDATTQWIVDNRDERNIVYVAHVGDIVQGDEDIEQRIEEWEFANISLSILDTLPDLPYGLTVGNHDEWPLMDPCCTELFNAYFPYTRYEGVVDWYGGHFGDNNDTHYIIFSGEGQDYLAIHTEFRNPAPEDDVLDWMEQLMIDNPDRKGIVVLHESIMPGGAGHQAKWDDQGEAVYERLKQYPNFFMILAGHRHGEGRRVDTFDGNTVYTLMHNFQIRPESGMGYFRLLEFAEGDDEIIVTTYTPVIDEFETDPDSSFSVGVETPGGPWTPLGSMQVFSGDTATHHWSGLLQGVTYEWYAEISDPLKTVELEMQSFTVTNCFEDLNADNIVSVADILLLISMWGDCETGCVNSCTGDLNGDGVVSVEDLLALIGEWGSCN